MPKLSVVPLFEKLQDEDSETPFEKNPKMFSSFEELQASIVEDLSRLLNTRLVAFWRDYAQKSRRIPFAYGVDIDAALSSQNTSDLQALEERIESAIRDFESRLIDPKVHVLRTGTDQSSLFINIEAHIIVEDRRIPISFPVVLNV